MRYYYTHRNLAAQHSDCHKKYEFNSKDYWDCRFKTQDWQNNHGDEQTLHFYTLLVNTLPDDVQKEIDSSHYTVADFGCAQGEGTEFFAKSFPGARVTGVDISEEGIKIAKAKHKTAEFIATDLTKYSGEFDVIISSNTMEHFHQPWDVLMRLSSKAKKYMIILVPFDQPGIPFEEHFYSFNYDNIPSELSGFKLVYTKIAHPDPKFWGEKQILLIYKKV